MQIRMDRPHHSKSTLGSLTVALIFILSTCVVSVRARLPHVFDRKLASKRECEEARDSQDELETFKLYSVNKVQSFHQCPVTCSGALSFEGSIGKCR